MEREELERRVLLFVKKDGLLGFISSSIYHRTIIGEERVVLMDHHFITEEKSMDEEECIVLFISFPRGDDVVLMSIRGPLMYYKKRILLSTMGDVL